MEAYVNDRRFRVDDTMSIGKGGEADVYDIGDHTVLKIFKGPKHADLSGLPHEQQAARERLEVHQKKLPQFPKGLPNNVVVPKDLATDRSRKRIIGYTMPFLKGAEVLLQYTDPQWRAGGVTADMVVSILRELARTVHAVHRAKVVIGDFNDLNVLVKGTSPHLIDADSFQFGSFYCRTFTPKFVDPLLCDPKGSSPILVKPYGPEADWFAFAVMLMQCLLFVAPYGGVYRPKDKSSRVKTNARPLHRISVFRDDVKRPKVMLDPGVLPDDLAQYLYRVFEKDLREPVPDKMLEIMRWESCHACGTEFARAKCPTCFGAALPSVKEVVQIRGTVKATRIFRTNGVILHAAIVGGKPAWLYHEHGAFRREGDTKLLTGVLDPRMRYRIQGTTTLMGKDGQFATLGPAGPPERTTVDTYGSLPVFDANESDAYWLQNGQLYRTDTVGPKYIGDVLRGQTLIWVGSRFGFGLYRAGQLEQAFVFDARARGINDTVQLPKLRGHLVDATCVFADKLCWFMVATHDGGVTTNHCFVIGADGALKASAEAPEGDESWLGTIRGACAIADSLMVASDDGIIRVRLDNSAIVVTQSFPDTEPFVQAGAQLLVARSGLFVVGRNEITKLEITQN